MTIHYAPLYPSIKFSDAAPALLRYRKRHSIYLDFIKRGLDLVAATLLLILSLPVLLIMAALVARDGKSPIYRQLRLGRDGAVFYLWKMRSMVPDADQKLEAYLATNPAARREWDHHQKLKHDPRITPIGRLIRKTSLDELPQLLNVIVGEMSLVGPRPMMVSQSDLYPGHAYYEVRPGITGAWQVSDRNEASFAERALYDTRYYKKLSLKNDLLILFKTVGVVFKATGH